MCLKTVPETLTCHRLNNSLALDGVLEGSSGELNNILYENHPNEVSFCFLLTLHMQMLAVLHFCNIYCLYSYVYITYFSFSVFNNVYMFISQLLIYFLMHNIYSNRYFRHRVKYLHCSRQSHQRQSH